MCNLKQQTRIASLTCQEEYMACSYASKACMWVPQGLTSMAGHFTPTLLMGKKAAIQIATYRRRRKNSRSIRCEFDTANKVPVENQIKLLWIGTEEREANIMIKSLGKNTFQQFYDKILE
ncbi:hypothetical protein O181_079635 [Austropuccinia psidii MF-1]|uniref:Uncharacterized protein n=1 Tax=Austropuccinia psidii MF-1 TaxID=1389203 RepID=A0A9Q3II45_9BASI|nr:hypothetical protein [Austropuccinia psidii MF-1]